MTSATYNTSGPYLRAALVLALALSGVRAAGAQGYGTDARSIGMGGIGHEANLAWDLVPSSRPYRSIPVPLGLFQVLENLDTFDPGSDSFNPAIAMSYASSPLHHTFNRGGSDLGQNFLLDIVNAEINPDLNQYRGFTPRSEIAANGLVSPQIGKTLWLFDNGHTFHGIYAGAGPYLAFGTDLGLDDDLVNLLASNTDLDIADSSFTIQNETHAQVALSFTGGYRLKLPLPGGGATSRDGIYLAANYTHLYGLHYENFDLGVQLDTDSSGLLTTTSAVGVDRYYSSAGKGRSIDVAVAIVSGRWDFTAAVEGLGNYLNWRDLGARQYAVSDVTGGLDFVETPLPAPIGTLRVELPVRYSGGLQFDAGGWAAGLDVAHGLNDFDIRGGLEYRFGPIDVRGGGRFVRDVWQPTTGIGLNLTRGFGIDVAMFGIASNIEQAMETGLALSLRFNQQQ